MTRAEPRLETTRAIRAGASGPPGIREVTRLVPALPLAGGMVDMIIRVTVMAVLTLALLNALHGTSVLVRLARQLARRAPHGGLIFWLPAFGSMRDVRSRIERTRALSVPCAMRARRPAPPRRWLRPML